MSKMKFHLPVIAACCLAYVLLERLNHYAFEALQYATMVHWIYLPSGLRLACVLIFVVPGAIGVALGLVLVTWPYFAGDPVSALATGVASGLAPLLARRICHRFLGMDLELRNLTPARLFVIAAVFAAMSAAMLQAIFVWRGYSVNYLLGTAVMALGDLVGTVIVLYAAKLLILALASRLRVR